jgi:hypothetical protein
MMVPDMKLGIVVLTNQEAGAAFQAITYHIVDYYMGTPDVDWVAAYEAVLARRDQRLAAMREETTASRDADSRPSLPLSGYAGTYADPWYGDVIVAQEGDDLVIRFSHTASLVGSMEHWQYDTFIARWYDRELRADAYVTFVLGPDGSIEAAKMRWVDPATDFSYDFHHLSLKPVSTDP